MCVQQKNHVFEGPAQTSDITILSKKYPNINFYELKNAMSKYGGLPLASDLAMIGAAMSLPKDDFGIRRFPLSAIRAQDQCMIKLPVMKDIVDWLENSALGTDMWLAANEWLKANHGVTVRFTMNCDCNIVPEDAILDGRWAKWLTRFNQQRLSIYGRTHVVNLESDDITDLNMSSDQLDSWKVMREVLLSLEPRAVEFNKQVA